MKAIKQVPTLLVILVLVGCSRRIAPADVAGRYTANRGNGVDVLEIRKDGLYSYTCKLGKTPDFENTTHWPQASIEATDFRNEGRWNLHYDEGEPRITLDHFQACARDYRRPPGLWDVPVERSLFGTIRLPIDSDVGFYFVKH